MTGSVTSQLVVIALSVLSDSSFGAGQNTLRESCVLEEFDCSQIQSPPYVCSCVVLYTNLGQDGGTCMLLHGHSWIHEG